MADVAESIAAAHSDVITSTVMSAEECEQLGMGAFLGVAVASENPPRFIHLKYSPPGGQVAHKRLSIVGKGLTFDRWGRGGRWHFGWGGDAQMYDVRCIEQAAQGLHAVGTGGACVFARKEDELCPDTKHVSPVVLLCSFL